ncbi:MAG: oligopeptidase A, partial [Granulosicoccaceae bacterium]
MSNPLLDMAGLPPFSAIKPEHVGPAIDRLLAENRERIETLLDANEHYSWDNLVQPIEDMDERLGRVWSPVSHMNSVVNTDALREAYNACLPKLSEYSTEMGQHERLYQAYKQIAEGDEYATLSTAQKKIIDNALRDFRLSGVALNAADKARYKAIMQ